MRSLLEVPMLTSLSRLAPFVLAAAALAQACGNPNADACCDCLVNKTADGADTTDGAANCLADDDASGNFEEETEKCPNTVGLSALVGGDNGSTIELSADGCREVCFDACSAVDGPIAFDTPVVSAGTLTATVGGVAEEATNVTTSTGPNVDNFLVNINAVTPVGEWLLLIGNLPRGPGTYPFGPFTDFGATASTPGDATGTFEVTSFDERGIAATFSGTVEGGFNGPPAPVAFDGSVTADFTVNDGEVSGLLGLQ